MKDLNPTSPSKKEAMKREAIQLIQSRCVHRRLGVVKGTDIVYCQDCEKILYDLERKGVMKDENKLKTC